MPVCHFIVETRVTRLSSAVHYVLQVTRHDQLYLSKSRGLLLQAGFEHINEFDKHSIDR